MCVRCMMYGVCGRLLLLLSFISDYASKSWLEELIYRKEFTLIREENNGIIFNSFQLN